jgi:hypothetical protein
MEAPTTLIPMFAKQLGRYHNRSPTFSFLLGRAGRNPTDLRGVLPGAKHA